MDKKIELLDSTTFAKKRFTRKQLVDIQNTITRFPGLSRREPALTICEHLNWTTDAGKNRIQACMRALEQMEKANLFSLPKKSEPHTKTKRKQKLITWTERTATQQAITGTLEQFTSIQVEKIGDKNDIEIWNEYVDRYHYPGYRRPMGYHLRYFITGRTLKGEIHRLGCLMFAFATPGLACRNQWIGWDKKAEEKRLHLVVNNTRFLIFPWVKINNLASKALALTIKRISDDWQSTYNFKPLLLETFIDPDKYKATCYKAANWYCIGKTAGKTGSKNCQSVPQKEIYLYPLSVNCKKELIFGKPKRKRKIRTKTTTQAKSNLSLKDPLVILWQSVLHIAFEVASDYDQKWQVRSRLIDSMLLILFIFRLVFAKNKQGYGITSLELWDQCKTMGIDLPQEQPISAAAFSKARQKLNADIFKSLNSKIIHRYESSHKNYRWHGHRVFAVDGSKINLPRTLLNNLYKKPSDNAHYPQGLISTLYQLKSKIPYDFDLSSHNNERTSALRHLKILQSNDIVIYDRGYFSYAMLYYHLKQDIESVFRLPQSSFNEIRSFFDGTETDKIIKLKPNLSYQKEIQKSYPAIVFKPLSLRLVKYQYDETTYVLGTTLLDKRYTIEQLSNLYHARRGVEELYKISKCLIDVGDFHAKSEQGIKQELYAHFALLTINRIFSNHAEQEINTKDSLRAQQVNSKNALVVLARNIEGLFLKQIEWAAQSINNMIDAIKFCAQRKRPNRKYKRQSMKPASKWYSTKTAS